MAQCEDQEAGRVRTARAGMDGRLGGKLWRTNMNNSFVQRKKLSIAQALLISQPLKVLGGQH